MWETIADWFVYGLLGLEAGNRWVDALHFFLYETLKIGFLLLVITHLMGLVNVFLPIERIRALIASGRLRGTEHLAASVFGAITPFCSCSSIPLFIGFLQGGIPLGVTLAFLITSPLVNEVALALFLSMFGLKVTLIYAISGIVMGAVLGWLLGLMRLERFLEPWVVEMARKRVETPVLARPALKDRLVYISHEAFDIMRKIALYVLAGVGIGAFIHGFVPTGYFDAYMSTSNPFAVPISVLVAVPMYANASAVIPIIQALVAKGIPLGTAMAFMMSVVGLSLPEAMMLKKVMQFRLVGLFFGSVAMSIVLLGYLFNAIF